MRQELEIVMRAVLIGAGATSILDLWPVFLRHFFAVPWANWGMVGRFAHRASPRRRTLLGMLASTLGLVFGQIPLWLRYSTALVPAVMGLVSLGIIPFNSFTVPKLFRNHTVKNGFFSAFLAGIIFSFAILPCATPALVALLSVAATGSLLMGSTLLFTYSLGAGIPLVIIGTLFGKITASQVALKYGRIINKATGVILIGLSFYMIYVV